MDALSSSEPQTPCPLGTPWIRCYTSMRRLLTKGHKSPDARHLCPQGFPRLKCFEESIRNYIGTNPKGKRTTLSQQRALSTEGLRGRRSWKLCPASLDTVVCFESYMALWLHMVSTGEGKRTFGPGKRSVGSLLSPTLSRAWRPQPELGSLNKKQQIRELADVCASNGNRRECLRRQLKILLSGIIGNGGTTKRSMAAVCRDQDPMSCFDHYITQLARFETSKQDAKGFVGKRSVSTVVRTDQSYS